MQVENEFYSSLSINKKEQKQKNSCSTYKFKKRTIFCERFSFIINVQCT